jgi:hypothetical protein
MGLLIGAFLAIVAAWSQWPTPESRAVAVFRDLLPPDLSFDATGRSVMALTQDGRSIVYNTSRGLYVRSLDDLEGHVFARPHRLVRTLNVTRVEA